MFMKDEDDYGVDYGDVETTTLDAEYEYEVYDNKTAKKVLNMYEIKEWLVKIRYSIRNTNIM